MNIVKRMNILDINTLQLSSSPHLFVGKKSVDRPEAVEIGKWLRMILPQKDAKKICILTGTAGLGKTVVLHQLMEEMAPYENFHLYALKADLVDFNDLKPEEFISLYVDEFSALSDRGEYPILIIDQIDALSKTLSADRKPITLLDCLVNAVARVRNAKVVISCRPYDLDFDPLLSKYKYEQKFNLGNLELEQVNEVLAEFGRKTYSKNSRMAKFLSTPINLELFLEYGKDDCEISSLQSLMDELWSVKIVGVSGKQGMDVEKLTNCLKDVTYIINESSGLACSKKRLETKYAIPLSYLISENILVESGDKKYVSFVHQSLSDYVSARLLCESGITMTEVLKSQHQGLYVRNRVKQYFSYIREAAFDDYIRELKEILVGDENEQYRVHIKLLLLTTLAGFEEPLDEEKEFVGTCILTDQLYRDMFVDAVYKKEWFNYITEHPFIKQAIDRQDESILELLRSLCYNVLMFEGKPVKDFLLIQIKPGNTAWNQQWMDIVERVANETISNDLKPLFEAAKGDNPMRYDNYLQHLAKMDYGYVEKVILEHIKSSIEKQMAEDKSEYSFLGLTYLDQNTHNLLEDLMGQDEPKAAMTYLKAIKQIDDVTRFKDTRKYHHKDSSAYLSYSGSSYYSYHEQLIADFIAYVIKHVDENHEEIDQIVNDCLQDERGIVYYMGIKICRKKPLHFIGEAIKILSQKDNLEELDSKISYQLMKWLQVIFPLLSEEQKGKIADAITQVSPEWERTPMPDFRKYHIPLYYIGRRKQELLTCLPQDYLIQNRPIDWKFLQEKNRDFKRAEISEPYKTYTKVGWNAHSLDKMRAMKKQDMLKAFRKYKTNAVVGMEETPTKQGECMNFEKLVTENPKKYIEVIESILDDHEIDLEYAAYGIIGLMKADYRIDKIKNLTDRLINELEKDLFNEGNLYSVMHVLREMDYFTQKKEVTQTMMDFMCRVAKEYPEEIREDEDQDHQADVYNTGVNRVRGSAAYHLVLSYGMPQYEEQIFEALESCVDATPATKGAIIMYQALLNNCNTQRNFELYMSLMKDLTPSLAMIPLNDLHPLVYFINTNFDDLKDFFIKLYDVTESHDVLPQILWIAWVRGRNGAEDLLHGLLDQSEKAKGNLIKYFQKETVNDYYKYVRPVAEWCMNSDDKEVGRMLDFLIRDLEDQTWDTVSEFIDLYSNKNAFRYAGHNFLEYMQDNAAAHPQDVLKWMSRYCEADIKEEQNHHTASTTMSIMVAAYNAVRKYDKKNELLEQVLDQMDILMAHEQVRRSMRFFLNELDNK